MRGSVGVSSEWVYTEVEGLVDSSRFLEWEHIVVEGLEDSKSFPELLQRSSDMMPRDVNLLPQVIWSQARSLGSKPHCSTAHLSLGPAAEAHMGCIDCKMLL